MCNIRLSLCDIILCTATLVEDLWLWASEHLLFLKALHILGVKNRRSDLMSMVSQLPDECIPC